jgi:4a-hydroxytetrahydrobiopterin dehydratase
MLGEQTGTQPVRRGGDVARLNDDDRAGFLETNPDWAIRGESLERTFVLADFNEAMGFVNRVALAAEVADHHPDIDIRWNRVAITLTTHSEGGLTAQDTTLAATIDRF